jgi:predicted dehydrogenase
MSDGEIVRLAVVGTGLIGTVHAERVADCPTTELAALCGLDEGATGLASRLGVPLVSDFRDVASLDAHGVVVATPNHLHQPMATFFLEDGLPVLVEKPIADTVSAGAELCAAGSRLGVPILIGHQRRHNSLVQAAREVVTSQLGSLIGFSTMAAMRKPDSYYEPQWRRSSGAGPLLVNLIHEVDFLRYVCGEIVGVQAVSRWLNRPWDFDDTAAILLHLHGGAIGTVFISESTPSPWSWESSVSDGMGFRNAGQDYTHIMGTEATFSFPSLTVWHYDEVDGEPGWMSPLHSRRVEAATVDPYSRQIAHFAQVVRRESEPLVSGEEGLRNLAVVEAVTEAGRTGALVDVDSVLDRP